MAEIQPIRILHISDFHLNGKYVDDAKTLLQNMLDAIENANLQIDLVIFSGDMIDKGGKDFSGGITEALNTFKTEIIDEICSKLKLTIERFVFTPGNHDVNTKKANELTDIGIETTYMTEESKVSTFIKNPDLFRSQYFQRIEDVKEFEKGCYESIMKDDYNYDLLASNFKYLIKDIKIGVTSLNSSWRYNDESKRKNLIVLGCDQITDSHPKIKDCQLKLAVTHYDYTELPEFEQETVKNMIAQNYDVLFVGHTHSSSVEFINTSSGASLLHMKTAGSLIGNKYISSIEYQNAFHILSYYPDHIDVVLFEQKMDSFLSKINLLEI
jgi:3',5'-cyclic AMP phosphodiesterase CpdA